MTLSFPPCFQEKNRNFDIVMKIRSESVDEISCLHISHVVCYGVPQHILGVNQSRVSMTTGTCCISGILDFAFSDASFFP